MNNKKGDIERQKIEKLGALHFQFEGERDYIVIHISIWYSLPGVNHKSERTGCNSLDNGHEVEM